RSRAPLSVTRTFRHTSLGSTYAANFSRSACGTGTGANSPFFTVTTTYLPLATTWSGCSLRRTSKSMWIDVVPILPNQASTTSRSSSTTGWWKSHSTWTRGSQPARAIELGLGEAEEAQVGLIVDDAGGVD